MPLLAALALMVNPAEAQRVAAAMPAAAHHPVHALKIIVLIRNLAGD